ncbi:MAG: pseudaminic acid biosynthesis-associated protein PseG [uncultured bacterium]|nr:MAG: pseudaminic acid biosynthesis-associated protein PseG [uncultured bacterium]OGT15515.1 MAG: UDP-2,4-diacetamido-2,4,6-trideoxy-beta-L-altropyranose hydrolase [Gammaproteobacteria bacterium RIFCSPHIGHO2_02_FULL_38_33]OGT24200.1 MAG: UDP-2,4-diacetamido-2,4,6-trideoxy-beta-L-altropyranose hydrolase [Gammaproteobacteria bacterium RIFCSPHIGHO2_12_38_15]OGT68197.1 MAG: UDP-2,4-diacetamido-2,4,6-trideoxy-beta-L-altropyranose hydrolase [Gammaproteobacteria bacterium RIFCSPLOWO2_02_FULL_38_11]
MKTALFRVDASIQIGTGHINRCLVLANHLREENYNVFFICRDYLGNLIEKIKIEAFVVWVLPCDEYISQDEDAKGSIAIIENLNKKIDIMIIDHYGLDGKWEKLLKPYVKHIMVIDDLANRPHECSILLDQNYSTKKDRYRLFLPENCKQLLGPRYLLIKRTLSEVRQKRKNRENKFKRFLVFMGGVDIKNATEKIIRALLNLNFIRECVVDIIVGPSNPYQNKIKKLCDKHHFLNYHFSLPEYEKLLMQADLAIIAGGAFAWECCYIGLPSLVVSVAENQEEISRDVANVGARIYLGDIDFLEDETLHERIMELKNEDALLKKLIENELRLTSSSGKNEILNEILDLA